MTTEKIWRFRLETAEMLELRARDEGDAVTRALAARPGAVLTLVSTRTVEPLGVSALGALVAVERT